MADRAKEAVHFHKVNDLVRFQNPPLVEGVEASMAPQRVALNRVERLIDGLRHRQWLGPLPTQEKEGEP